MPIYDFRCADCSTVFEARVGVSELAASCPACGSAEVVRVYTAPAIYEGPAPRGLAARRSNAGRAAREEKRWDGFRKQREQLGLPPRGPSKDA